MKYLLLAIFLLPLARPATAQTPPPPNIILFLVDDMGWQDCSVPFAAQKTKWNELYRTPNMERLAAQGMKFTQAFANQNCTPTRVSLMTGMNVVQHGVTSWIFAKDREPEDQSRQRLQSPAWRLNGMATTPGDTNAVYATPLPVLLRQAGYTTIHVGKAHLGARGTPAADPGQLGFDRNIGGSHIGHPASYLGIDNFGNRPPNGPDSRAVPGLDEYWGKDIFLTEALTQKALHTVDSVVQAGRPFFLQLAHYAVHLPFIADKRYVQRYYAMGMDSTEALYAALLEGMDKSLGDVMDYLEKRGLTKNTLLVFMSDNGGLSDVRRGAANLNQYNSPARSGKTSGYDGGLRIPMLAQWPGHIAAGSTCGNNVIVEDFFATCLALSGLKKPAMVQRVDGQSWLPLFAGKKAYTNRPITWHYPHQHMGRHADVYPFSAIRQGSWKLLYNHTTQGLELYNTLTDVGEQNNLAASEPKRVKQMAAQLGKALRSSPVGMPVDKATKVGMGYPDGVVNKK